MFRRHLINLSGRDSDFEQGHHHNGDEAARGSQVMCSACGRRCTTPRFRKRGCRGLAHSVARPWVLIISSLTHKVYLLQCFDLLGWLQRRFSPTSRPPTHPPALTRPFDSDTMTITALEAIALSRVIDRLRCESEDQITENRFHFLSATGRSYMISSCNVSVSACLLLELFLKVMCYNVLT